MSDGTSPVADESGPSDSSRRERILSAALEIFADRGFDGTTTRLIAERAGTNHGLIRYYFETKETLWKSAVDRAFAELLDSFGDALDRDEPIDDRLQIEQMIRRFVEFSARRPQFMRLMNDEGKRDGPRMQWLVERHVRPVFDQLEKHVGRAQQAGVVPPMPIVSFHYILVGAAGLVFSQAPECEALTGTDPSQDAAVAAHADAVVALLLGPNR